MTSIRVEGELVFAKDGGRWFFFFLAAVRGAERQKPGFQQEVPIKDKFKLSDGLKLKLVFWVCIGLEFFSHLIFEIE